MYAEPAHACCWAVLHAGRWHVALLTMLSDKHRHQMQDAQWATSLFELAFRSVQNCKYKVNILRIKWKSTIRVFSVAILTPVFTQLILTSNCDQNSGVTLVFGLSEKTERKTNPKSEVTQWLLSLNQCTSQRHSCSNMCWHVVQD